MDKLNDLINEAHEKNVNEMLKSIKFLLDYKKISLKEYQKILKRIHNKKMRETCVGLKECKDDFQTVIKVPEGKYLEDVHLKEGVSVEGTEKNKIDDFSNAPYWISVEWKSKEEMLAQFPDCIVIDPKLNGEVSIVGFDVDGMKGKLPQYPTEDVVK